MIHIQTCTGIVVWLTYISQGYPSKFLSHIFKTTHSPPPISLSRCVGYLKKHLLRVHTKGQKCLSNQHRVAHILIVKYTETVDVNDYQIRAKGTNHISKIDKMATIVHTKAC